MTTEVSEDTSKQLNPMLTTEGNEINIKTDNKDLKTKDVHKLLVGVSGNAIVNKLLNQACNCCKGESHDDFHTAFDL